MGDISRDHIKVLNCDERRSKKKDRKDQHVSSSLPPVTIRHAALQSHSFLGKGEPGGTVTFVGQPPSMVDVCVCGYTDGLIWGF